MAKERLKGLIQELIPENVFVGERESIANEVMNYLFSSSLNSKISNGYDENGNFGIFYPVEERSVFKKEIKSFLRGEKTKEKDQEIEKEIGATSQNLEKKFLGKQNTEEIPEIISESSKEGESLYTESNTLSFYEACNYLKTRYNIIISPEDLTKILRVRPITFDCLKEAKRFKLFELLPLKSVGEKFHKYNVTIINGKTKETSQGAPRFYVEWREIIKKLEQEGRKYEEKKEERKKKQNL